MGRPKKKGVDYIPLDVKDGKTIYSLERLYGNNGFSFFIKLLRILASEETHSFCLNKPSNKVFLLSKTMVSETEMNEILQTLMYLDQIDEKLFKKGVIWCQGLVDRLEGVYQKRGVSVPEKPVIATETNDSATEGTQSKVKESKVKESRNTYGEFGNVLLTEKEHEKLKKKFNSSLEEKIEELSVGIASKGYKYKSHYATILSWARKKEKEEAKGIKINSVHQAKIVEDDNIAKALLEKESRETETRDGTGANLQIINQV